MLNIQNPMGYFLLFLVDIVHQLLGGLAHPGGQPGDDHDPQGFHDPFFGPGHRFLIIRQGFFDEPGGLLLAFQGPGISRQPYEQEIQVRVPDNVVGAGIQVAVDIGQQGADLFHGHGGAEHIDGDDAAELLDGVALVHRAGQEAPLDPILK